MQCHLRYRRSERDRARAAPPVAAAQAVRECVARRRVGRGTRVARHGGMAAVFALIFLFAFASILLMIGEDPAFVMSQMGHTDSAFTLRVYTHAMRRDEGAKERMKAI